VSITLNFRPEIEAGLAARAKASGLPLEEYLLVLAESAVPTRPDVGRTAESDRREAVRQMIEFGDKYRLSLGEPVTRSLLHEEHRF
jgi:hypothetical protein